MPHRALCIILARTGSKGLPSKNALDVAGKPMLAWTIEHAKGSHRIGRIVVSTDGEALADIARRCGVEVVIRPEELASDTASVDAAVRHCVKQLDTTYEHIAILYGNVPVRPSDLTDRALAMLEETGADSVQSLSTVGKHHPYWMKTLDPGSGELKPFVENNIDRRQDLPPVYELDGGVIAVTRDSLMREIEGEPHAFLGNDRRAITVGAGEVVDVDTAIDLQVAEAILKQQAKLMRSAG